MMYGERRITIAALRDTDLAMARALVIRLQNVCATIDEMLASLPGRVAQNASTSKGEFGPAPDVR